jgi:hypothetical protein
MVLVTSLNSKPLTWLWPTFQCRSSMSVSVTLSMWSYTISVLFRNLQSTIESAPNYHLSCFSLRPSFQDHRQSLDSYPLLKMVLTQPFLFSIFIFVQNFYFKVLANILGSHIYINWEMWSICDITLFPIKYYLYNYLFYWICRCMWVAAMPFLCTF